MVSLYTPESYRRFKIFRELSGPSKTIRYVAVSPLQSPKLPLQVCIVSWTIRYGLKLPLELRLARSIPKLQDSF